MSSLSSLEHAIKEEADGLKVEACLPKIRQPRNQIARSSWSKNCTHYPLRRRHLITMTNASEQPLHDDQCNAPLDSLDESLITISSSSLFFSSSDEKNRERHGGAVRKDEIRVLTKGYFKRQKGFLPTELSLFIGRREAQPPLIQIFNSWKASSQSW